MTTYNLFDIVKNVINSKNPREYIKKIKNRKYIYGYYLIEKNELIKILKKSKSKDSDLLLTKINNNNKTGYELDEKDLLDKYNRLNNYINIGDQLINYEEKLVKYVYDDKGNVYFRGKDICNILEYTDTDQPIRKLLSEIHKIKYIDLQSSDPRGQDGALGNEDNETIYINEAGLFKLIMRSKKPGAEKFTDWICEDVLPSIRKYGYYKLTNAINISDYLNCCCMYIFNVEKNIYKYGITKNIRKRLNSHYSQGLLQSHKNVIKIYKVSNYSELMDLEKRFKKYCYDKNINYKLDSNIELFKSDDINNELKIIGELKENISPKNKENTENNETKNAITKMDKEIEVINTNITRLDKEIELSKLKLEIIKQNKHHPIIDNKQETIPSQSKEKPKEAQTNKKCKDCSNNISKRAVRCGDCENKNRFEKNIGNRPDYKTLLQDFKELKYYTKVGNKYGVSDNAVRKWLKLYKKYEK